MEYSASAKVIWLMKSSSGIGNRIIPGYVTYSEAP
jgi:hypothetical protein